MPIAIKFDAIDTIHLPASTGNLLLVSPRSIRHRLICSFPFTRPITGVGWRRRQWRIRRLSTRIARRGSRRGHRVPTGRVDRIPDLESNPYRRRSDGDQGGALHHAGIPDTMPRRIRPAQRMSPRVGVAVQVLRVARPPAPRRPRRPRGGVVRRRGQWAGPRHHTVRRDEAPQPRVVVAGMLLQPARPVQPLAGVIQAGLADAAAADFAPRGEFLLAEQRAGGGDRQTHTAKGMQAHPLARGSGLRPARRELHPAVARPAVGRSH